MGSKHDEIPVVDLNDFHVLELRSEFIDTIGTALHDIGFLHVRAPYLTAELQDIYETFKKLFSLPDGVKAQYMRKDIAFQRGWTPSFSEIGIACRQLGLDEPQQPDAKEGWFIGPDISLDHHLIERFSIAHYPNIWPAEVPEFRPAMCKLYDLSYEVGLSVLQVLGHYLGLPNDFANDITSESPTVLRALHYPGVKQEEVGKITWGCAHTDINLLTVLPGSTKSDGRLFIRRRDGEWIPSNKPAGCVTVQVGDMLQELTSNDFLSAQHEIRAPDHETKVGRISSALFVHARCDYEMKPFNSSENDGKFPTMYERLIQRLDEIGLNS